MNQLIDTTGFNAPWGITTAERRHPGFCTHGSGHGCEWDWFCLNTVLYHGKTLTILYDKIRKHYGKGQGFIVFSDGKPVFKGKTLSPVTFRI